MDDLARERKCYLKRENGYVTLSPRDEELVEHPGPWGCRVFTRRDEEYCCSVAIPESIVSHDFWQRVFVEDTGRLFTTCSHVHDTYNNFVFVCFSEMGPGDEGKTVYAPMDCRVILTVTNGRLIDLEITDAEVFLL